MSLFQYYSVTIITFLLCFQVVKRQNCLWSETAIVEFQSIESIAVEGMDNSYIRDYLCYLPSSGGVDLQADTFFSCAKAALEARESL